MAVALNRGATSGGFVPQRPSALFPAQRDRSGHAGSGSAKGVPSPHPRLRASVTLRRAEHGPHDFARWRSVGAPVRSESFHDDHPAPV
jgi:hypothetical protein